MDALDMSRPLEVDNSMSASALAVRALEQKDLRPQLA
jgi:hypothetical protein